MSFPRRTSWWFPFVLPGSPLLVVSESAGPSRWAAEAGAEEGQVTKDFKNKYKLLKGKEIHNLLLKDSF